MNQKIKEHFSDIDNAIIYILFLGLFFYELYDEGLRKAVWSIAVIAFLISGWFSIAYAVGSIRARNFTMDISDAFSVVYFLGFSSYWIVYYGLNRKAFILLLPVFTGLVLVSAHLFAQTNAYRRLDTWEKRFYKKIFSVFKKRT